MLNTIRRCSRLGALGLLGLLPLAAQVPKISAILNDASGTTALAPGVRALILGSYFGANPTIQVGGRQALVIANASFDPEEEYLIVQFPAQLATGPTQAVLTTTVGSSMPFPIVVDEYAPGLYPEFTRSGRVFTSGGCTSASETASPGDIVTARAVGLGVTTPGASAPTLVRPAITVGGLATEVLESMLSPDTGVYHVRFRVPPGDGRHPVVLEIGGRKSNPRHLPVGKSLVHWGLPPGIGGISATEAIITVVGCGGALAPATVAGDPRNPPTSLAGTTVRVIDSAGAERSAPLLYVSPQQVNYVVPARTARGNARVLVAKSDGSVLIGTLEIRGIAPQLFSIGMLPAAVIVRLHEGLQTVEPIFRSGPTGFVGVPIDLGPESDQLFLLLFGTGLRFGASVTVTIGGVGAPVDYSGPQSEFPGLDQINVRLPRSLAGHGNADVKVAVDGELANVTRVNFQ